MEIQTQNPTEIPESPLSEIDNEIGQFIDNAHFKKLLSVFGYEQPEHPMTLQEQLLSLKAFTNTTWDFRGGKERYEATQQTLTEDQEKFILDQAEKMGMVGPTFPSKGSYDAILILGAIGKQPLLRTEFARDCGAEAPLIVSLGSENPLPADRSAVDDYAPTAKTEFGLMKAAIERAYGREPAITNHYGSPQENRPLVLTPQFPKGEWDSEAETNSSFPKDHPNETWKISHYPGNGTTSVPEIFALSSPSSEPEKRRANTADTYNYLSHLLPSDVKDILIVTCGIFVPFQGFDAERMLALPYGKTVETIGFDTRDSKSHKPQNYLQEINSAINSANLLYNAAHSPSPQST
jgi:hypothetical protein